MAMFDIDISGLETPKDISGEGHKFIDGDTLVDDKGNLLRIEGLSAPEIMHLTNQGELDPGGPGGLEATRQIESLAKQFNYNNIHKLTNPNGSPKMDATGTRQLVRITDDEGRDFVETLSRYGINKLGKYSSQEEIQAAEWGAAKKSEALNVFSNEPLDAFEQAQFTLEQVADKEQWYDTQFAKVALDEQQLAGLNAPRQPGESIAEFVFRKKMASEYSDVMVLNRHSDRTLQNKSLHPWADGFDTGLAGAIEGMFGVVDMIGEESGFNWVEEIGEAGIKRQQDYMRSKPELKMSILKPVLDADGNVLSNEWDVGGIGGFFEYIGNMAAISLPYMGVTFAGTVAAPMTGGVSMLAPVGMFAGMTYNEMEGDDKSATLAVASGVTMTVLDRLGIKALMGGMKGTLLKPEFRKKMVEAYMKKKGVNDTVAKAAISKMTRMESAKLLGSAAQVAKEQLTYGNLLRSFAARSAQGFGIESTTELGQELTQYMASVYGSDKPFNAVELHERLVNAFVAGGTLGSGFAVPGAAYDAGAWADVNVRIAPREDKRLSKEGKWAREEEAKYNVINKDGIVTEYVKPPNIKDYLNDFGKAAKKRKEKIKEKEIVYGEITASDSFQEKEEAGRKTASDKDIWEKLKSAAKEFPVLWRASVGHAIWDDAKSSPTIRQLGSFYGAFLHRVHPGRNFEETKQAELSMYRDTVMSPAKAAEFLQQRSIDQKDISNVVYKFYSNFVKDKDRSKINWDNLPDEFKEHSIFLRVMTKEMQTLGDKHYNDQRAAREYFPDGTKTGKEFKPGYIKNYLGKYKSLDKVAIEKNKAEFIKTLEEQYNFSNDEATKLTDAILENNDILDDNSLVDFNIGRGTHIPSSHKSRTLGLDSKLNNKKELAFDKFLEKDLFINLSNASKSAARYTTYQKFVGDNGEIINEVLTQAIEKGEITRERANRLAAFFQDYLNAESGNYKRIENTTIANIQKNILVWTTLAGLPLATISSLVEFMMTMRALSPEQIQDVLKNAGKEFAEAAWVTITNPTLLATNTKRQLKKEERQARLKRLGYFDWDVGAAQTTGATENTFASRYLLDKYFRVIGLQQWTDYTRNVRASVADDFIMDHLAIIKEGRLRGDGQTNEEQESEEQLRNLGINVTELLAIDNLPLTTPSGKSREQHLNDLRKAGPRLDDILRQAEYNFVNEAIALPGTSNRPLFYQNPHLALFTQFQGFIATFTANQIPRLWGDYIKRGTPKLKYNAFAIMTTMIMLGFVTQHLKDLLKYGTGTPYLDRMEKLQRGIGSSGMIGVAERPLNFFFPIYETSSSNMIEGLFDTISGEAPPISNISRAITGLGQVASGNVEPGLYKIAKTTPLIGPFNIFNRKLAAAGAALVE